MSARSRRCNVTVTQKAWEAGILGNGVTLPFEIGPNLPAFTTICTLAQNAAGACPPGAKMGTATATSSFVDKPLTGNVYAVEQAGVPYLPGLVADLRGRVNAQIRIATQIIGGKYIRSTVTDVPDLPMSSFSMSLIGGDKGPLESKFDLCFKRANRFRTMSPEVTFSAHSGKRTASKPRLAVEGCPPAATASLRHAGGRRATLKLTVERHPDAENIEGLSVTLPRGANAGLQAPEGQVRRSEGIRRPRREGPRDRQAHTADLEAAAQGVAQGDRHAPARSSAVVREGPRSSPARASGRRCASRCARATRAGGSHTSRVTASARR